MNQSALPPFVFPGGAPLDETNRAPGSPPAPVVKQPSVPELVVDCVPVYRRDMSVLARRCPNDAAVVAAVTCTTTLLACMVRLADLWLLHHHRSWQARPCTASPMSRSSTHALSCCRGKPLGGAARTAGWGRGSPSGGASAHSRSSGARRRCQLSGGQQCGGGEWSEAVRGRDRGGGSPCKKEGQLGGGGSGGGGATGRFGGDGGRCSGGAGGLGCPTQQRGRKGGGAG